MNWDSQVLRHLKPMSDICVDSCFPSQLEVLQTKQGGGGTVQGWECIAAAPCISAAPKTNELEEAFPLLKVCTREVSVPSVGQELKNEEGKQIGRSIFPYKIPRAGGIGKSFFTELRAVPGPSAGIILFSSLMFWDIHLECSLLLQKCCPGLAGCIFPYSFAPLHLFASQWFGIWGNSEPQPHTHWQWLPVCKCFKLIGAEVQREMRGWDLLALMHRLRGTAFKWSKPMQ